MPHNLVDRGVAYINAAYNGNNEPWLQELTKVFLEDFPRTTLDRRFTSEARYEESVSLLRKELEKWMDARGGRTAKAYSEESKNRSDSSKPADVMETMETKDTTHSERGSQSDGDQITANKLIPQ
ncbi:uncharacterized protein EV420DRAFT_1487664 [Desarmillaria tabescens]|uniref:Uncharacterized protein n=1 Tax=Armillaria tabescens TaxID=1929756 RepID=A0AA39J4M9_ARMTA|nr:uncharacterized protein EV420DRAFT_1487664 [Desarmillaria tabescens]KAK0436071.1 hypothetical protein EV420DRAFT_1487664 [Desarmillaria tabescens]